MARIHAGAPASKRGAGKPKPRPVGRPTKYEPRFCEMLVEDMAKGFSLTAFAGLIGVSRSTLNEWIEQFPEFSEAASRGKALRLRDWENVALEMRRNGGGPGGATITVFGLKNMGGDEWSDTTKLEAKVDAKVEHSADDAFAAFAGALERAAKGKAEGA